MITLLLVSCSPQKKATDPNILLVLVDDMGYSDLGCYGGEIRTPNIDDLAKQGVRLSDLYMSPLCAPSRAMLLTGVDNHLNGLGTMPPAHTENQYLKPGYEGVLNNSVISLPEILKGNGYHTYMSGKWHLGHHPENYPIKRGFEKSFAFLGGGSGHFNNYFPLSEAERPISIYVENEKIIKKLPDDFYSFDNLTNVMIEYITSQKDDAPFFGYLALTAPHDPLHVPDKWLNRYRGVYDEGYDVIKKERLARMKALGLVEEQVPFNPGTGKFSTWASLNEKEKKIEARKMEIYASMVENLDYNLGRLIDTLKRMGKYENTLVIFMSDNGANPKDALFYPGNSKEYMAEHFDNDLENLGRHNSFISQGGAWAEVSNTPFTYFKTTAGEGGLHSPLVVSGPGVKIRGIQVSGGTHVTDIVPTLLDMMGITRSEKYNGKKLAPLYGKSAMKFLSGDESYVRDTEKEPLHFEMLENRAVIKGDWKALMLQPPYVEKPVWQLFNIADDPLEKRDISLENPQKLSELAEEWQEYAKKVGYIQAEGDYYIYKVGAEKFYDYENPSN